MRFYFRTKKFKICVAIICSVIVFCIIIRVIGGVLSPGSGILGTIAAPFQSFFTTVSNTFKDLDKKFNEGNELLLENHKLKEENDALRKDKTELEVLERENAFYKDYLGIKESNPDFAFCDARLIAVDKDDIFKTFTLNKGSADGVEQYDPVIVGNSLIGYVCQVGLTTCKVSTLLNPEIVAGAIDSRTGDAGIITGTADFAKEGKIKLYNLARSCQVAVGDTVITSGEGLFPDGLLIGTVESIKSDSYTSSLYATVVPLADFDEIRNVMIITDFEGQGLLVGGE